MKADQRNPKEIPAQDVLNKWQTYVDQKVQQWLGDGDMSWHPGAGQALDLQDDQYTPEDMRLAYRIMQDNDAVPPWMALGFVLRDKRDKITTKIQQYAHDYLQRQKECLVAGQFVRLQQVEERWKEAVQKLFDEIKRYNSEVLDYNLQVPAGIEQMVPLDAKKLIARALEQAESNI